MLPLRALLVSVVVFVACAIAAPQYQWSIPATRTWVGDTLQSTDNGGWDAALAGGSPWQPAWSSDTLDIPLLKQQVGDALHDAGIDAGELEAWWRKNADILLAQNSWSNAGIGSGGDSVPTRTESGGAVPPIAPGPGNAHLMPSQGIEPSSGGLPISIPSLSESNNSTGVPLAPSLSSSGSGTLPGITDSTDTTGNADNGLGETDASRVSTGWARLGGDNFTQRLVGLPVVDGSILPDEESKANATVQSEVYVDASESSDGVRITAVQTSLAAVLLMATVTASIV